MNKYPLFKILLPICFGFIGGRSLLCHEFGELIISFLIYTYITSKKNVKFKSIKNFAIYSAAALYFITFAITCSPKNATQREVNVDVLVTKAFRPSNYYNSGICKIIKANNHHQKYLEGTSTFIKINKKFDYKAGDFLRINGLIEPISIKKATKLNSFDHYLFANNVKYSLTRSKVEKIGRSNSIADNARDNFLNFLAVGMPTSLKNVYQAILFGKKEFLSSEIFDKFFYTGTMHIFAVSGLHVGTVAAFFFFFFKLLRVNELINIALTLLCVFGYVIVVGFSASTTRAFIMIFFLLFSKIIYRQPNAGAAFFAAMLFTLIINPWSFFDIGFQLSYGVVAGILWIGMPLAKKITQQLENKWQKKGRKSFVELAKFKFLYSLSISFGATLISSILVLYYWKIFSPWAIFVNLLLIPVASIVVILGLISSILGLMSIKIPMIINYIAIFPIKFLIISVDKIFMLPLPYVNINPPPYLLLILATIILKLEASKA